MNTLKKFPITDIEQQLQRILKFATFKSSPTLTKFLEFVLAETFTGRELHIKEYSIAINVLGRSANFNPQEDAVVRIHAGRLRKALNEYYLTEGINDPIVIQIPKGGYIPQFHAGGSLTSENSILPPLADPDSNPIVAVFPFKTVAQTPEIEAFALVLGEALSAELSRFQDISVIGYYSMEIMAKIEGNVIEAGKSVEADYIITGSIQCDEPNIRIRANLLITATGEVVMTKFIEAAMAQSIFEIQDEIIENVVGAVGGYYGPIVQHMAKASPMKVAGKSLIKEAMYKYFQYQRVYTIDNYTTAVATLEHAVKMHPDNAVSLAMLGQLYAGSIALGINKKDDEALAQGYEYCKQALNIDPFCQQAWHTLTWIHLFRGDKEACIQSARKCIELNPNYAVMVSGVAFMLICAGEFEEGFPVMEKAIKLNPYYSWWINGGFCFYYLYKKEYATALQWAEKMNSGETFWDPLLKTVSLAYLNDMETAEKCLATLLEMEPDTPTQIKSMLSTLLLSEELIAIMMKGLKKVGLK